MEHGCADARVLGRRDEADTVTETQRPRPATAIPPLPSPSFFDTASTIPLVYGPPTQRHEGCIRRAGARWGQQHGERPQKYIYLEPAPSPTHTLLLLLPIAQRSLPFSSQSYTRAVIQSRRCLLLYVRDLLLTSREKAPLKSIWCRRLPAPTN